MDLVRANGRLVIESTRADYRVGQILVWGRAVKISGDGFSSYFVVLLGVVKKSKWLANLPTTHRQWKLSVRITYHDLLTICCCHNNNHSQSKKRGAHYFFNVHQVESRHVPYFTKRFVALKPTDSGLVTVPALTTF